MHRILVMMSTYNGEKYLEQQINSVLNQEDVDISLLVRDDGSNDSTQSILNDYMKNKKLDWYTGENLGPALSFLDLLFKAGDDYDYYAFCDQDDVWLSNKIIETVQTIENFNKKPALAYCATKVVDENLEKIGHYYSFNDLATNFNKNIYCFGNAQGCCMVFNKKLLEVTRRYKPSYVFMHDTWIHKICLLNDGIIKGIDKELILYRQHGDNVIGIKKKHKLRNLFDKECLFSSMLVEMTNHYEMIENSVDLSEIIYICEYKNSVLKRIRLLFHRLPRELSIKQKAIFKRKVLLGTL